MNNIQVLENIYKGKPIYLTNGKDIISIEDKDNYYIYDSRYYPYTKSKISFPILLEILFKDTTNSIKELDISNLPDVVKEADELHYKKEQVKSLINAAKLAKFTSLELVPIQNTYSIEYLFSSFIYKNSQNAFLFNCEELKEYIEKLEPLIQDLYYERQQLKNVKTLINDSK